MTSQAKFLEPYHRSTMDFEFRSRAWADERRSIRKRRFGNKDAILVFPSDGESMLPQLALTLHHQLCPLCDSISWHGTENECGANGFGNTQHSPSLTAESNIQTRFYKRPGQEVFSSPTNTSWPKFRLPSRRKHCTQPLFAT